MSHVVSIEEDIVEPQSESPPLPPPLQELFIIEATDELSASSEVSIVDQLQAQRGLLSLVFVVLAILVILYVVYIVERYHRRPQTQIRLARAACDRRSLSARSPT